MKEATHTSDILTSLQAAVAHAGDLRGMLFRDVNRAQLVDDVSRAAHRLKRAAIGELPEDIYTEAGIGYALSGATPSLSADLMVLVAVMMVLAPPLPPVPIPGITKFTPYEGDGYCHWSGMTRRLGCTGEIDQFRNLAGACFDTMLKAVQASTIWHFDEALKQYARALDLLKREQDRAAAESERRAAAENCGK